MKDEVELPTGWTLATIEDVIPVGGVFVDGDWVESKDQDPSGDVRLIQLADIGDGHFNNKSNRHLTKSKAHQLNCTFLEHGDLLIARMPDPLGRCCLFPLLGNEKFVTVVDVCVVRLADRSIDEKYLKHLINSPQIRNAISDLQSGSTRKRISRGNLASIDFPIAPLTEQRRIVAKIEELFSELDKGVESLKAAQEQLKVYRQAMLKHAFEGKLTADWRAANSTKLETSKNLLTKIHAERAARQEKTFDDWNHAVKQWADAGQVGPRPSKPRHADNPPPVTANKAGDICSLPEEWVWVRPGDVASDTPYSIGIGPFGSNLKVSDYRISGVPLIFVKNITRRNFALDLKYIDQKKLEELGPHTALPSDILLTKMGDPPGDCAIYPDNAPIAVITADCLKFRIWDEFVERKFFAYCLESLHARKQLGLITRGVAQKKISVERFKTLALPLPSRREQLEIVDKLDASLSTVESVMHAINDEFARVDALRQSILNRAFSGHLVPQDPCDEPASVLLERIKAERCGTANGRKKNLNTKEAA